LAAAAAALASPMGDVHGDFHAPSEIERCRGFPFHDDAPELSGFDRMFRNARTGRNRIIMKLTS
jgi:hypothetical protein